MAYASASGQRMIVGATEPSASRTDRDGTSVATQALAVAITIALRTPTLLYPCQPSSSGA